MDDFWKSIAVVLTSAILGLAIGKTEKDLSVLLTMTTCSIVGVITVNYLKPVLNLLKELTYMGQLQDNILMVILKSVGIALVSEFASMVCIDAGNNSLAKVLQLLGCSTIAFLSVPMIRSVLSLIEEILFIL